MSAYLVKLGELKWSQVAMFGFLAAAVYYLLLFDDGTTLAADIDQRKAAVAEGRRKLEETKTAVANADRFQKEVETAREQFAKIIEYMPSNLTQSEMTNIVSKEISGAGAKVIRFEPVNGGNAQKNDVYDSVRVKVTISGTFVQIVKFLSNLSNVPKLLTFDRVQLENSTTVESEAPVLSFEGVIAGHRYLKSAKATDGTAASGEVNHGAK